MDILVVKRFYKIVMVTLCTIYLVILAGGVVRSTGSGMGCPDWPKCFGTYIPPTKESQLPPDYKEKYKVEGHAAVFNPVKTWIEYVNRLLGALAGVFVLIQCIYALRLNKYNRAWFLSSLLLVFLMGFQGLLGAKVVSTFLKPVLITLHMGVALIIMGILIWLAIDIKKALDRYQNKAIEFISGPYKIWVWIFIFFTAGQIFLGTEVRSEIDVISYTLSYELRDTWIDRVGSLFLIHRSYSILITAGALFITWAFYQKRVLFPEVFKYTLFICAVIGLEVLAGIILAYAALPFWAQPVHLLLATLLLGVQLAFVFRFMVGQNIRSV